MSSQARPLFRVAGVAAFVALLGIIAFGGDRDRAAVRERAIVFETTGTGIESETTTAQAALPPESPTAEPAAPAATATPASVGPSSTEITGLLEELDSFELGPIAGDDAAQDTVVPATPPPSPTPAAELPPVQFGSGEEQPEPTAEPDPVATPDPTAVPTSTPVPTPTTAPEPTPTATQTPIVPLSNYLNPQPGINVGVPDGTALTPVGPNEAGEYVITEDNAVIDGLQINACVEVRAANVTIRNSHLTCDTITRDFERYPVDVKPGASLTIEYSLIECVPQGTAEPCPNGGIWGSDITAIRNEIRNVSDAFNPLGGSWVFRENYVHDQAYGCASYQPDGQAHADAIQAFGGTGVIEGNYIQGWRGSIENSCDPSSDNPNKGFQGVYVSSESWNDNGVPNVVIRNNLFSGFQHNAVYCFGGSDRSVCNVENNTFEQRSDRQFTINIGVGSSRCNRWADSSLMAYVDVREESDPAGC